MSFRVAHISDLHITSNSSNLKTAFWDFVLLAGPPAALVPILRPYIEDPQKRENLWKKLIYHSDGNDIDFRKVAAVTALSIPAAIFLSRQFLRLKRIFYLKKDTECMRQALLADLSNQRVKHVVITGDITNVASEDEFVMASKFVKKLRLIANVTLIPGNHDVNIQRLTAFGEDAKLDRYIEYFGDERWKNQFPYFQAINDICFISLDSTCFNPLLNSRGSISEGQLDRLNDMFHRPEARNSYKVLVLHHHIKPEPKRKKVANMFLDLSNANDLISIAESNRVDLILHGHEHKMYEYDLNGIMLHCAGATTNPDSRPNDDGFYNIFEFSNGAMVKRRRGIPKGA
ncbi:MAG TPA: metallophosphoesterase [bacterium]|nr:metallophosphoesterase [bacterium]